MLMKSQILALAGLAVLTMGSLAILGQNKKLVLKPPPHSDPTSGAQMYKDYCASCHGEKGKGDGPASEFLKSPLPDLTTLAQRNHGKYPASDVMAVLRFGSKGNAHGTIDMPIWGDLFSTHFQQSPDVRMYNLTKHLESVQENRPDADHD